LASDPEFQLVVTTPADGSQFMLPTSSWLDGISTAKVFDWHIEWGDSSSEDVLGMSSDAAGVPHEYMLAGTYTVTVTPNGPVDAWLAAFGFGYSSMGANSLANKSMLTGVASPIRPEMTRSAAQMVGSSPAPSYEWANAFNGCSGLVQAPAFEGWEGITDAGDNFAESMFYGCASLASLPEGFNLPADIIAVGNSFASNMFYGCTSLVSLPASFNLPQSIVAVPDGFALSMFNGCTSLASLPTAFDLPASISVVGELFASSMFYGCSSLVSLPAGFYLPQGITVVEQGFCFSMFLGCASLIGLPAGFNLPQGITAASDLFAWGMFSECSSLASLPSGFNLPQGITSAGIYFAANMFLMAGGPTFQINAEFSFPAGIPLFSINAFNMTFQLSPLAPVQARTAASIIGSCPTPMMEQSTFDYHFTDIDFIHVNWGGGGLTKPPVGLPGTGDLDGDGFVTMSEVLTCARAALGDIGLSPEQLACIDMDGDGFITMFDVMQVYMMAIQ